MNRRLFLGAVAGLVVEQCIPETEYPSVPAKKELVLDYLSTKNNLHRGLVLTDEVKPSTYSQIDGCGSGLVMLLCAKRAWVLPDGCLEVEHFSMVENSDKVECYKDIVGGVLTYTIILKNWVLRSLDITGQTVSERRSKSM